MIRVTRTLPGLLVMLFFLLGAPLQAQLDPRLQGSTTDFLNLYQQSTNTKVKPEILTVFDFSGSMARLMFHPLFVNTDKVDAGGVNMEFSYATATDFVIKASPYARRVAQDVSTSVTVAVGGSMGIPGCTDSSGGYQMALMGVPSGVIASGTSYTFTASVSSGTDKRVVWTCTGGHFTSISDTQAVWVAPSVPCVTATLASGDSANRTLYSTRLIKPNGGIVTEADDASNVTTSGQRGESYGSGDVRNWVRAASHVRFQFCSFIGSSSAVLRTVDIPIPWKITNGDSTGNPLKSQTVKDLQTVTKLDGTVVKYGSETDIEMDTSYAVSGGRYTFSGDANQNSYTKLSRVEYRQDYIQWLFNGVYADGSNATKYIVFDALNANLAASQAGHPEWGQGYGSASSSGSIQVPQYNPDGSYAGKEVTQAASKNVLPALTRVQAVKRAVITTWINHQSEVLWAFRFLDYSSEASNGSATDINNDSATSTTTGLTGNYSGWKLLNGNSVTNMAHIASRLDGGNTPLTYAMARGLAQFTDPNSIFNTVEKGSDAPSQCMNHFLILFTDGLDNNGTSNTNTNGDTPYVSKNAVTNIMSFDAAIGNKAILTDKTRIRRDGANWNLFTFAGIAAHMANPYLVNNAVAGTDYLAAVDPGTATTSGTPDKFLPFAIKNRNGVNFERDHRITTMTVGVSLGGKYTEDSSPKRSLFLAAAVGDPLMTSWPNLNTLIPFVPKDGTTEKPSGSIYFFDAMDPDTLTKSLGQAILSAIGTSNLNTSANPNTPYIGASLGQEIYVGKFQPPQSGGSLWDGDLLMFGTRVVNNQLQIINKQGDPTTTLDTTTSQWNVKSVLDSNAWSGRLLYTRLPNANSLSAFSDMGTDYDAIKAYICQSSASKASYAPDSDNQKHAIQFAMGGDTTDLGSDNRPKKNRSNIMGDIINSSPAAIEYKWADFGTPAAAKIPLSGGNRFRLILVGTNQGWLHAFGEVTRDQEVTSGDGKTKYTVKQGQVAELWAFMPTDFLGYLDQITIANNPHRFMVDGSPAIYHLDIPPSTGGAADGVVGSGERAVAIVGLGKGGRSYYALDISDPFAPTLKWSVVPDEASSLTDGQIQASASAPTLESVKSVVGKMGYSTCIPGVGRITLLGTAGKAILRDAVFLGGGFSRPEIESNFSTPLGRSVMALDAYSGKFLAIQDLTDTDSNGNPTRGPVYKGVVPFEFFINSGMAQRAYFLDYWGGLWAWGSTATDTQSASSTYQYRIDTSEISSWGLRKVAQDQNGGRLKDSNGNETAHYREALYTTLPAPFRVGSFPGMGRTSTNPVPAVVGIAMESGDRNNPLDQGYATGTAPDNHRLTVIFDRQDSAAWTGADPIIIQDQVTRASATDGGSGRVMDAYPLSGTAYTSFKAEDAVISPGNDAYYLAPMTGTGGSRTMDTDNTKFGYYRHFPNKAATTTYLPKGINTPAVVSGSLFYSYFTPTAVDICIGGSGNTTSSLICDVLNPIVDDNRPGLSCDSGIYYTWYGTASDYIPFGTRGVIQIGTNAATDSQTLKVTTSLATKTIPGQSKVQYPKPRVWRTVH
ncbi:PilC/PilY family type IV pilus protein [Holophaga foetida]|uniref:PilC/PilY family type IV pilus protein n=1 Tax=Holophaga foetida TaxID=35839 RepID=UPI0002475062|nr:PilC/PilY family type IV pilus protein [Holophaga foetida]